MKDLPFLQFTVIGYGLWQSRNLLEAWRHSPFDRWGWLACFVWLVPFLVCNARSKWPGLHLSLSKGSTRVLACSRWRPADRLGIGTRDEVLHAVGARLRRGAASSTRGACAPPKNRRIFRASRPLLLAGLVLTFLGDVGSFNVSRNAGLALILLAFAPPPCRTFTMALSSASWMPALGWFGSEAGLGPAALNAVRLGIALAAVAAWALKTVRRREESPGAAELNGSEPPAKICSIGV
ncbi:MAG: hypothetical protein HYY23_09025 [Verrucomicrobia bacterium]|nr:hypothetical protein [Verrucomicrobiota bacterium]